MKKQNKNRWLACCRLSLGMKMAMVFMLVAQIAFSGENVRAQQNISIEFVNSSLSEVLKVLKEKTNYEFLYNDEEIRNVKKITNHFNDASVEEILKSCLEGTGYDYKMVNNLIVITPVSKMQQQKHPSIVKGKIVDERAEPLPGATVVIKGIKMGVTANIDGLFNIEIPAIDVTLVISFVGMQTQEIQVKDLSKMLIIVMKPDTRQMEEVVVTGYGNIKKQSFTGSAVSVKGEELLKVSPTNIISALQTFDPSFRIQTNNQWGSDPNALPEMYVRGRSGIGITDLERAQNPLTKSALENNPNLPTFILDGFEVAVQKVYDLDPTRIENVTILKDAAATAMYGSRAANGVVVITTIAPKPGQVRVSYNFTGGLTMPDLTDYNLADAKEKLEIEELSGVYDPENFYDDFARAKTEYYTRYQRVVEGVNTDWLAMPLRNVFTHKHSLYVEGGNEDLRYGLDAQYNNEGGVMKDSYRRRAGAGFYVDYRLKNFQVKNYVSYTYMKAQESPYGSFSDYSKLQPYDRPYDEEGELLKKLQFTSNNRNAGINNPLYEALLSNFEYSKYDEFLDNVSLNWYINPNFSVKGQFSVTKQFSKSERFIDPLSTKCSVLGSRDDDQNLLGDLYLTKGESTKWDANAFAYYQRTIVKHSFNLSLGMNATSTMNESTTSHYRGFPSGQLHSPNYAAELESKPVKTQSISRLFGVLASLNYTFDNVYLLDASVRTDGSSQFGSNQKWSLFWSGGLGINIHNYNFLKESPVIRQLKLRASYGQTGKVSFAPYSAITTYEAQADEWYATGYGVKLKALGNPDLSWETTNKTNIGTDIQLFKGMINLNVDYYYQKTIDLITDVTVPTSSGFKYYKDNLGEVENKGFELNLRLNLIQKQDLLFSLWGNMAHNKNKILKISESLKAHNDEVNKYYEEAENKQVKGTPSTDSKYAKPISKYEEGGSLTSIFAMRSLGIDPTNGKEIFMNRDGSISYLWKATEEVIVGNTEPKLQGAFGMNATYKNVSLFISFIYEYGGQLYNETLVNDVENADIRFKNVDKRVLTARWKKPGDVTQLKNIKDQDVTTLPSSRFVQDNNILSLNAVTLSYDFGREFVKKIGLSMLRFEMSTNDIARFSSIRQERGTSYPYARTVNFSLKANF